MRIVSLLPGATEFVFALGLEPVGVSHECDYPPGTADIPTITRSQVDGTSTDTVDAQVQTAMTEEGGVFEVDGDRLADLDPDLIITQGTCEVCAVDADIVSDALAMIDVNPRVLTVDPHTLEEVLTMGQRIGEAIGAPRRADRLVSELSARLDAVEAAVAGAERPTVTVLDWLSPVMVAGHWVPELVQVAGGRYPLAEPGVASRVRTWEAITTEAPEVLIAAPCGLDVTETRADADHLTGRPGWSTLPAVRNDEVYAMDGNAFLNRPGPRVVEATEYLASVLHPEVGTAPPDSAVIPLRDGISHPEL